MRKLLSRGLVALATALGAGSLLLAATVKTRSGQVVTGEIKGVVIQRGPIRESGEEGNKVYSASYCATNGNEVAAIDEAGVRSSVHVLYRLEAVQTVPIDDAQTLSPLVGETLLKMQLASRGANFVIEQEVTQTDAPAFCAEPLLGTFTTDAAAKTKALEPRLEIITAQGPVEIPVTDIVEFKKRKESAGTAKRKP